MKSLIPNRMLFDFEFPLAYRSSAPTIDGQLHDWTDEYLLPDLGELDGQASFGQVWACWSDSGLSVACRVSRKRRTLDCNPKTFWKSDHLRLCTDMRDARANKRATRFCQQFHFLPTGGGPKKDQPAAGSSPLKRAREDAPPIPAGRIQVGSKIVKGGYSLEAHIPTECLSGFDPIEHPRIGLYYMLEDKDLGQQYLTVGDDLYWYVDPSVWATAVLSKKRGQATFRPRKRAVRLICPEK